MKSEKKVKNEMNFKWKIFRPKVLYFTVLWASNSFTQNSFRFSLFFHFEIHFKIHFKIHVRIHFKFHFWFPARPPAVCGVVAWRQTTLVDLEWGMAARGGRKKGKRWKNGVRTSASKVGWGGAKRPGWMVQKNEFPRKLPQSTPNLRPQVNVAKRISRASKGRVV